MSNRTALSDRAVGLLFIAPFVTAALFFMVYPIVEAIRMAFYSYNPLRPELTTFVGFDNFAYIFADPLFWDSFRQATVWTFLSIVFQTVFGVAIAMMLHQALPGMAVFRGLLLFPYIVPTVVIALIWRWIFNPEIGVVNYALLKDDPRRHTWPGEDLNTPVASAAPAAEQTEQY